MPFSLCFYRTKTDPRRDLQERMYHILQVYFEAGRGQPLRSLSACGSLFDLSGDLSEFLVVACLTLSVVRVATSVYGTLRQVRSVRVLYGLSSSTRP